MIICLFYLQGKIHINLSKNQLKTKSGKKDKAKKKTKKKKTEGDVPEDWVQF